MKFVVGDKVFNSETFVQGEITNERQINEHNNKNHYNYLYQVKWDNGATTWISHNKISLSSDNENIPLDLVLLDILIDNSLDNKNVDDFLHYVKLKKELQRLEVEDNDGSKETGQ